MDWRNILTDAILWTMDGAVVAMAFMIAYIILKAILGMWG